MDAVEKKPHTAIQSLYAFQLGLREYTPVWQAMQHYTQHRDEDSNDQLWIVEHPSVFTVGQAGDMAHVLSAGNIPVIHVDRGGQVTYHGPGQVVIYPLIHIARLGIGIRCLVNTLEEAVIQMLAAYGVQAERREKAPGVFVDDAKIASLGLRVRRGCTFHGLAMNVAMDLSPFNRINPCGFQGLTMTQLSEQGCQQSWLTVSQDLSQRISDLLGLEMIQSNDLPTDYFEPVQ